MINIVDPDVIVLGGGLSNIARLYDRVPRLWGGHVFSDRVATRLRPRQARRRQRRARRRMAVGLKLRCLECVRCVRCLGWVRTNLN